MTCLTDLDLRVLPWCNSLVASQWREIAISVATAPIQIKEEKTGKKTDKVLSCFWYKEYILFKAVILLL